MIFDLSMSLADLLLLLPEILLTCWLCVLLIADFSLPRLPKENLAYLSVAGLVGVLGCLAWFDLAGISGTLPRFRRGHESAGDRRRSMSVRN